MTKDIPVGAGAGLVAALLFGVLLKGSVVAFFLSLLVPLPILIVGLGWSYRAAIAAVVTGALVLALLLSPYFGLVFTGFLALPAGWLAYLALLGRTDANGTQEWYPTGRLLAWVAGTAALAFVGPAAVTSPSYDAFNSHVSSTFSRAVVQFQVQRGRLPPLAASPEQTEPKDGPSQPSPDGASGSRAPGEVKLDGRAEQLVEALTLVFPAFVAQGLTILFTFYLWAAARIVQISGRLLRPWPDLPSTMMPRSTLLVFAAALTLAMVPGYPGALGIALIGAFSAAFALQGLAAFHDRSRGRPGRFALLAGLYVLLFLTQGVAMLALILFGIADTALDRRRPQPRGDA
ncbi:DUF2232 domain-containing protein [Methylorubrum sp. Q1]|uniref:DUF2232 domain-containing protein n=1 Tax=Methylorubrum sp. Q1 TaxID=2562453 RepID=UPI0010762FD0|nr:DUF2232 domain-containing protein [Methylorubrum sp. Q1]TFZ56880.1 DUF2232 domain-containing protein [Methylorubrum sp. Q1]